MTRARIGDLAKVFGLAVGMVSPAAATVITDPGLHLALLGGTRRPARMRPRALSMVCNRARQQPSWFKCINTPLPRTGDGFNTAKEPGGRIG
jgi:hypothetical protein